MKINVRSKLIVGYITLLFSVSIAAFYGYYSLSEVVEGKKNIKFFTHNVIISNSIYQYMSEARQAQTLYIKERKPELAEEVKDKIQLLQEKASELKTQAVQIGDKEQIEMAKAISESSEVYLETFQSLKSSVNRRGVNKQKGIQGQLTELKLILSKFLPVEYVLKMGMLESGNRLQYHEIFPQKDAPNLFTEMYAYAKRSGNDNLVETITKYHNVVKRLYFENLNSIDLLPLMHLNAEMIELLVVDNVVTAQQELDKQFSLTEALEHRQKIISLFVMFITISAGFLAVLAFGTEALDLSKLNLELAAILEAIRDGIVAVNREEKITLINQRAKDLLRLKSDYLGKHILELFPNSKLPEVMKSGIPQFDQEQQRDTATVLTTRIPVLYKNETIGGIVCFRRKEELSRLAGRLTQVNAYIDALRANNHEFNNRLQTIQGMVQLGETEEVLSFIQTLQTTHQQRISLYVGHINNPAISAILLGKYSRANELGITMTLSESSQLTELPEYFDQNGLVSVVGNLLQNAIDAVKDLKHKRKEIRVNIQEYEDSLYFSVADNGPGVPADIAGMIFESGFTTKRPGHDEHTNEFDLAEEENMGMGLYISKNHVISMGGSIQYKRDHWTTFEVTIPKQTTLP